MIHSVNDWKSRVWWLLFLVILLGSGAQGQEINSSTRGNSSCPGQTVVFTCTRQITSHEWLLNGQQAVSLVPANLNIPIIQDGFTYSVTDAIPGPPPSIVSTATVVSTTSLNGTEVACADGTIIGGDPNPSTITALVFDTTPRNLIFQQSTPSSGRLSWTPPAGSETCVSSYSVNIVGVGVMPVTDMFLDVSTSDGLIINTVYTYTVTSNPGGVSSATGQFQIVNYEPPSPSFTQLNAVVVNTGVTCSISSVTVNWVTPDINDTVRTPPVIDYTVSCPDNLCDTVSNIPGTTHTITRSGIAAGTYTINVAARNSFALSAPVSMMFNVFATTIISTSTVTNNSASITFTLSNTNCNTQELCVQVQNCTGANCLCSSVDYGGAMEFTHTVGNNPLSIPGLSPVSLYCYRATISIGGVVVGSIDNSFTTELPMPPQTLNFGTARLLSVSGSTATYECVNSAEGFRGTSRQTVTTFDPATGLYTVPLCSVLGWFIAVLIIIVVIVIGVLLALTFGFGYWFGRYRLKRTLNITQGSHLYEDPNDHPTQVELRGPLYEVPEDIKPDPHTEGNLAYGHVQPLSSRQ